MKGRLVAVMWDGDPDCQTCDAARRRGWRVVLAEGDPRQALAVIRAEAPDAVLIDLDQRPADGRAVAVRLGAGVPVVFLSGEEAAREVSAGDELDSHVLGADRGDAGGALMAGKDDPD